MSILTLEDYNVKLGLSGNLTNTGQLWSNVTVNYESIPVNIVSGHIIQGQQNLFKSMERG